MAQPSGSPDKPQYLVIGEVLRPHGVRGEIRMRVLTDYPERVTKLPHLFIGPKPESPNLRQFSVRSMRMHQGYGLLKLEGVTQREHVDALRGLFVMVDMANAVPLEDDEVYLYELIGMQVEDDKGDVIGTLKDVLETGANDVYIVTSPQHGEVLIPVTDETLLETDTDTRRIVMRLPDGLLD